MIPRLAVAGTHSGVGKTTVATGLMAALAAAGRRVAGFKVGPDFIDPSFHALATGRPGRNLDPFLSGPELIAPLFEHGSAGCDIGVVEGAMGLFDGKAGDGDLASTAHVARLLGAPVVLVVDASSMAGSAAALVHGFATFDPRVAVGGVILNRVASGRHEEMLREALHPLGIPVAGVLRRDASLAQPSRHLGLVPARETPPEARRAVASMQAAVTAGCDLGLLARLASSAPARRATPWSPQPSGLPIPGRPRIGIAGGPAFTFMYRENLELLEAAGAELVCFNPAADPALPEGLGGLIIGGGFPEVHAGELSGNLPMISSVRDFASSGRPVLAECGGLLYLCRSLDGKRMCGLVDADAAMTASLSLGYRSAEAASDSALAPRGARVRGHEFHYSRLSGASSQPPAWRFGTGSTDGFLSGSVHAGFLHTHWAAFPEMARRWVGATVRRAA